MLDLCAGKWYFAFRAFTSSILWNSSSNYLVTFDFDHQEVKSDELEGIHKQQSEEMKKLKQQYKDILEENISIKTNAECLEKERNKLEQAIKG